MNDAYILPTKKIARPKAIIFDWDNTLANTWPVITECLNTTRAHYGLETWSVEEARRKSTRSARDSFPVWFGEGETENAMKIFYDRFAEIHCDYLEPMPGAGSLLVTLKKLGLKLFVISNKKDTYLKQEVNHLGWYEFFEETIGSGVTKRDKPARDPVDFVLGKAGLQADDPQIWLVGDTDADISCALDAGCTPTLIHDKSYMTSYGVPIYFSDCHTMETALYNWLSL